MMFLHTEEGFDEYKDYYLEGMGVPHAVYVDVTSIVCRHACVKLHSDSCCSVVYERANRRCLITPVDHNSTDTSLVPRAYAVYYKRRRCSGLFSLSIAIFNTHKCCVVMHLVASVTLSVCPVLALTFECLDLQTSLLGAGTPSEHLGQGHASRSRGQGERVLLNSHIREWSVFDWNAVLF